MYRQFRPMYGRENDSQGRTPIWTLQRSVSWGSREARLRTQMSSPLGTNGGGGACEQQPSHAFRRPWKPASGKGNLGAAYRGGGGGRTVPRACSATIEKITNASATGIPRWSSTMGPSVGHLDLRDGCGRPGWVCSPAECSVRSGLSMFRGFASCSSIKYDGFADFSPDV